MSEWNAIDLHMHTVEGVTGDGKFDEIKNFTYKNYLYSLKKYDIKLASPTNHNTIDMTNFLLLRYLSIKCGINLLLGVELDADTELGDNYHFVCLFDENDFNKCMQLATSINTKTLEKKRNGKVRFTGSEIIDLIKNYNTIIIPHGDKSKGIYEDSGNEEKIRIALQKVREGFVKVFDNRPSDWKCEMLKKYLNDSKMFENIDEFGGVLFSDNRNWSEYGKKCKHFYMNAEPTFRGFLHSITNPEQRFATLDLIPRKSNYISKMVIKSINDKAKIADQVIYFNSGYNCVIGKSGTGKSLLLYLIRKTLSQVEDYDNYKFIENNKVEFYDEKGNIMDSTSINLGVGEGIINKILSVSNSKDGNDMYPVISKLKSDFKAKVKFNLFVSKYKKLLLNYTSCKSKIESIKTNFISQLNVFKQENDELDKLKDIKTFASFVIDGNEDLPYSSESLLKITDIAESIKKIEENMRYYDKEEYDVVSLKFNEFKSAYYETNTNIFKKQYRIIYKNYKKKILRDSIESVNKGISKNAARKTSIQNGMDTKISTLVKYLKNYYLLDLASKKFDLSIKIDDINSKTNLFTNENIDITENIDPNVLKEFDIKNNDLFNLHGLKGSINSKVVDLTDKSAALSVIDKYYSVEGLTPDRINRFFEKDNLINVNVFFDKQNVKFLNPGTIAKKYIDLYFNTKLNNGDYSVVVYDQIENDVDKEFIKDDILGHISKMKDKVQIIIVTHDPIVAVNADPTNYIISTKDNNGIIHYRNFVAESSVKDELKTIANTVDGSKSVIKKRYDIYKGENDYVD